MRRPSGIDRLARSILSRSPTLGGRLPFISLIYVLSVAEHLSFRHAATTLGVSQGSVSARVKTLDEDLGILSYKDISSRASEKTVRTLYRDRNATASELNAFSK